jgi:cell division septation protein DedD
MKRRALALCASLLLLGLMPGATLAATPPSSAANLDQWNNPETGHFDSAGYLLGQTFTVGKTGMLSGVGLNLYVGAAQIVTVDIYALNASGLPTGSSLASTQASLSTLGTRWVHFSFPAPLSVTKNAQYAIVFNTGDWTAANGSSDTYAGGQALWHNGPWAALSDPADFAFMTFVDTATATLAWDKPSITAGTSTQLTLTGTVTYTYGSEAVGYSAVLDSLLPSWYDPATIVITCDWAPGCTLAGLESGYIIVGDPSGAATLTFTLVGTAKPLAADVGTPGTVSDWGGCLRYPPAPDVLVSPNQSSPGCAESTASVQVVAAPAATPAPTPSPTAAATPAPTPSPTAAATPAPTPTPAPTKSPTPPPTSTGVGPGSDNTGGTIWFLPFALVAAFGGLLILVDRRRRRII